NENPYFNKNFDPNKPFDHGELYDPIMMNHPSQHGSDIPIIKFEPTNAPKNANGVKAHENPPGAWQQSVPEGSNVNWLNAGIDTNAKPMIDANTKPTIDANAKPTIDAKAKPNENPPGAWQQAVPEGSNVNWLNNDTPAYRAIFEHELRHDFYTP